MSKHSERRAGKLAQATSQKDRRLRMIWNSNGTFVPSGYGIEMRDLLYRFLKDGWPVAQIAFSGLEGAPIVLNGLPIYPKMGDTWGSDAMLFHSKHFQAQVTFSMQDVWTLQPQTLQQLRWIPYVPIDQDPVPPNVLANLKYAHKIITFSQFGYDTLLKAGFVSTLILEGTDINIFKPLDQAECRKELGLPQDKFIVGMVGANKENPPRKGWQQALEAFKSFHDNHPDSLFFFQTNQNSPGGFPIRPFAEHLKISNAVLNIDEYLGTFHTSSAQMVKFYNAWDILCHPSLSEGFGLCALEAQASGLPVIVNNCTSMPEIIENNVTGYVCDTAFKWYTNAGGYHLFPDSKSIAEKLETFYALSPEDKQQMKDAARKRAVAKYDIDMLVKTKWIPLLESLQTELLGPVDQLVKKI